jgi:hypothetical protein
MISQVTKDGRGDRGGRLLMREMPNAIEQQVLIPHGASVQPCSNNKGRP